MRRIFELIWTYYIVNLFELDLVDSDEIYLSLETWNVYGIKIQFNIRGVRVFDFGPQQQEPLSHLFSRQEIRIVWHRIDLPMAKVGHLIDFINRPHFNKDVAYDTRVIKIETGEELAMPNVLCTVIRTIVVNQYIHCCYEGKF